MTRRRDERGASVVDFVMIMGLLVPLFTGVLQVCLVLHVQNTLSSAAAEGARRAAVIGATPADGYATTVAQINGSLNERFTGPEKISITQKPIGGVPGYEVAIRAEVPALGLGGPAVGFTVTGNAIIETP